MQNHTGEVEKTIEILLTVWYRHLGNSLPLCFSTSMVRQEPQSIEISRIATLTMQIGNYFLLSIGGPLRRFLVRAAGRVLLKNHARDVKKPMEILFPVWFRHFVK